MRVKKVTIENFRGLENVEFELNDKVNVFAGDNRLGKSTIIDAIMWVLCDETLVNGKADSDNRDQRDLKKELHVTLEMDNGIILERKYRDVWKEDKDGNLKFMRTDNKTLVNGANFKKAEFFDYIKSQLGLTQIIKSKDFNLLRGIIDYNYFSSIDYKVARKFLEELLGLKSDTELINEEEFKLIKTDATPFTKAGIIDTVKLRSKYKNAKELAQSKIDDKEAVIKQLKEKEKVNKNSADPEGLEKKRNDLILMDVRNDDEYKTMSNQIAENDKAINDLRESTLRGRAECEKLEIELTNKGTNLNSQIENNKSLYNQHKNKVESLKKELETNSQRQFELKVCPHCGKPLNENEHIEWEKNKAEWVSKVKDEINSEIANINGIVAKTNSLIDEVKQARSEYKSNHAKLQEYNTELEKNIKANKLISDNSELRTKLNNYVTEFNNNKNNRLMELNEMISNYQECINLIKNIKTSEEELKNLKKEKAKAENQYDLVVEFENVKKKMIRDNSNKVFPDVDIELLSENENTGTISDTCRAKLKGVEYSAINDGHRYLVGIKIIEDIKKALGLQDLPIIFDKFGDIGDELFEEIKGITNAQIFTTLVTTDKNITLKENR